MRVALVVDLRVVPLVVVVRAGALRVAAALVAVSFVAREVRAGALVEAFGVARDAAGLRVVAEPPRLAVLRALLEGAAARLAEAGRVVRLFAAPLVARVDVLRVVPVLFARVAVARVVPVRPAVAARGVVLLADVERLVVARAVRAAGLRVVAARFAVAGAAFVRVELFFAGVRLVDAAVERVVRPVVARPAGRVVLVAGLATRVVLAAVRAAGLGPGFAPVRADARGVALATARVDVLLVLEADLAAGFLDAVAFRVLVVRVVRVEEVRALEPAVRRPPARTAIARVRRPSVVLSLLIGVPSIYADNHAFEIWTTT